MRIKPRHWLELLRSSFWFVPGMLVLGAVALAATLIGIDTHADLHALQKWPLFFGAGAAGARGLLTTVAGSMVTVAGVGFSITLVALSLTSSQYTSRVLRNFMRDTINQIVLGVFVGIFAYCLVVLRTIRAGDEGMFVPSLAVMGGLVLAFVGIGFLIYFIHHISLSIQASTIIATVAGETIAAVDRLYPDPDTREGGDDAHPPPGILLGTSVLSKKTGYLESVDHDALLSLARENDVVVRMERCAGEFVVDSMPLVSASGALNESATSRFRSAFVISRQRTLEQDAGFGIRQIVDIALRALSPGINDSTTAVICVDYLSAILGRMSGRRIAAPFSVDNGILRVIGRGPRFETFLGEAFEQIRQNADGNIAVLTRLLNSLESIAGGTVSLERREALRQEADLIAAAAARCTHPPADRESIDAAMERLAHLLLVGQGSNGA